MQPRLVGDCTRTSGFAAEASTGDPYERVSPSGFVQARPSAVVLIHEARGSFQHGEITTGARKFHDSMLAEAPLVATSAATLVITIAGQDE